MLHTQRLTRTVARDDNFCAPRNLLVALLFLLPLAPVAQGWNDTGHETVAAIAFAELNPTARAAVIALLRQHPRYEKDLLANKPENFDPDHYAFMIAATWPDLVRAETHPMHFVANHPAWHYINIDYTAPGEPVEPTPGFTPATQPAPPITTPTGPRNIVEALTQSVADLKSQTTTPAEKAIALCWLLHLGGDIHQPLHAINFFSKDFPTGDRGGTGMLVLRYPNQIHSQTTLHWLWDCMLGTQKSPVLITYLAEGLRSDPRYSRDALKDLLTQKDFTAWTQESHALAIKDAYQDGVLQGVSAQKLFSDPTILIPPVPPGYIEKGERIAMLRIATAGHRVADVLNQIFPDQANK